MRTAFWCCLIFPALLWRKQTYYFNNYYPLYVEWLDALADTFTHYLIKSNILLINDGATKITILSSIVSCLQVLRTPAPTIYGMVYITRVDTLHLPSCNFFHLVTNLLIYFLFIFHLKAITMFILLCSILTHSPLRPSPPLPQCFPPTFFQSLHWTTNKTQ